MALRHEGTVENCPTWTNDYDIICDITSLYVCARAIFWVVILFILRILFISFIMKNFGSYMYYL